MPITESEEARIQAVYARRQGDAALYSYFNPGHLLMLQQRQRTLLTMLSRDDCTRLDSKKILEIGCGKGYWLREFINWGAQPQNITGIDLLAEHVSEARRLCPAAVTVQYGNAAKLEFPDRVFDIVVQSTVLTSVLDSGLRMQIAAEMIRVLKPDGLIIWHDFRVNNPWNPDVRGIGKREILQLFPHCRVELRRIILAPPLARAVAPYSWLVGYLLESIPWLCTHYAGIIRKP